jgi:hypothetical protein
MPHIKIVSSHSGIDEFDVLSYEILGLPAGTYHKLTLHNGNVIYHNDFGVKYILISPLLGENVKKKDDDFNRTEKGPGNA